MVNENGIETKDYKIRTFRWLFYMSLFQLLVCLAIPIIVIPIHALLYVEILIALTIGLLFGLYFMGVCIYGIFVDKSRFRLYIAVVSFVTVWTIWSVITWLFIDQMRYLT
jgi:hypothetical protein